MKKITKLMLALTLLAAGSLGASATKLYATYGTPASSGSFESETGTYTWTASYSNLMDLFTFSNGELASFESIHFTTSDYVNDSPYRICFMVGSDPKAIIAFYSAGEKNLVFSERTETKDLDLSTITSIKFGGASGNGSIKITKKPYLQKPMTLDVNENGEATIDKSDLVASGCLTLDDETGELVSNFGEEGAATLGRLAINFPTGGVDLSNLTGFTVNQTGTVLFSNFEIGSKGFWSSIMGRNDLANYVSDFGDPTNVTVWRWNVDKVGTQTITSVTLKFAVMTASDPHETPITALTYVGSPENHLGETMGQGSTIYGMGNNIDGTQYVDLSGYDEMRFYGTPNKKLRLLFNWTSGNQKEITGDDVKFNEEGYYSLDLTTFAPLQLNCIKFPWDGATGAINKVILYKKDVAVPYTYVLSGAGNMAPSATAALADATATSYDATGITKAVALATANPNALIVANDGMVTNTQNVIVTGVCANLVLTDGYPFKAPAEFTATKASYATTINATAKAGTLCLPFAAAIPEGVKAYTLAYTSGDAATATEVEGTIPANTPVLLNGSGAATFDGSDVSIDADAANVSGALTGVFEATTVPTDSYVLQNGASGLAFYKVDSDITAAPFRAYLTAASTARSLKIDFGGTTAIESVATETQADAQAYDLQGRRISKPAKGLYIVNGKKYIAK